MLDKLYPYYKHELTYLQQLGKAFAERHHDIAAHLQMAGEKVEDPHVKRLVQSFAFLTARIHKKLDDDFPEISDALLGILYPHFLRPIPSLSIAQFHVDPQNPRLTERYDIERHSLLNSKEAIGMGGEQCKFRTCYPVELWPIHVQSASLRPIEQSSFLARQSGSSGVIRIALATAGAPTFANLDIDRLRFFIDSESHAGVLLELLLNHTHEVVLTTGSDGKGPSVKLGRSCLRSVGFAPDEQLLEYDPRSFLGYRLLTEYFVFPGKFHFFEITGLSALKQIKPGKELEIAIFLDEFERKDLFQSVMPTVKESTFQLGCTPIVNLFEQPGHPLRIKDETFEYPVIPDDRRPRAFEVYAITGVEKTVRTGAQIKTITYRPFFSNNHMPSPDMPGNFWFATRQPSALEDDDGTDMSITLVDIRQTPTLPQAETLMLDLLCTNRDLAEKLHIGGEQALLEMPGASVGASIRLLRNPTPTLRPDLGKGLVWKLISHLSLNYLSLVDGGREALQELLHLYNFASSANITQQIASIIKLESASSITRIGPTYESAFVRGTDVAIEFDEKLAAGGGSFLFSMVLDHFFGLYCAMNSYVRLTAKSNLREREIKKWPARTGTIPLI